MTRTNHKLSTLLVVDDSPVNLKLVGKALQNKYKIRLATNGKSALDIANSSSPPDLILLDIMMSEMDGYEVCRKLKENDNTKNIPVIFITAKDEEEDETTGLEIGAVDYITKPFSLPILKARVKTHIELKRHRDFLENLSSIDGLTGIANRRRFDEIIRTEWAKSITEGKPFSLIMIDIDHFKRFNDNYGHIAGDDCLKKVASILANAVTRDGDFVARYGGEEFAILLSTTGASGAKKVAERFRKLLKNTPMPSNNITCSLGVATIHPQKSEIIDFIDEADKCLYQAKESGRDCVKCIDLTSSE